MPLLLPNNADAYNLGLADGTRFQAVPDATDYDIMVSGMSLAGAVSTGCEVTAQGSPNNTVAVAAGVVIVNGVNVNVTAGNVTMTAADASGNRRDIVYVTSGGTKTYLAGTAVASSLVPVKPAIPANSVVLAEVLVPANDNVIDPTQIQTKRMVNQVGGRSLGSAAVETDYGILTATSLTDLTGLSTTVVVGGRPIIITLAIPFMQKVTAVGYVTFTITEGTDDLADAVVSFATVTSGQAWDNIRFETKPFLPSMGSHTYKARYSTTPAGIQIFGHADFPNVLNVLEV